MGLLDFFFRPPTPDKFAAMFIREMHRAGVTDELTYDRDNHRIIRGKRKNSESINLSNFFKEYLSLPRGKRRRHLVERARMFAAKREELPDDFDEARSHLRPKLWTRVGLEKSRLQVEVDGGDGSKMDIPEYEIGSHLIASLAYDFPQQIMSVSREQLEKWGITYYEALEIARENLEQEKCAFAQIGDGCYVSATGDSYDSSRLLLPNLIERFEVKGNLIAMVPNRDYLLVAGSDDEQGLTVMLDLTARALEHPRPMVPIPLRLDGDDWVDWMPPRKHPLAPRFQELARRFLYGEYEDQLALLNRLHEQRGIDLFVAAYSAVQKEDGSVFSYAVWSQGCHALLPRAEWLMFFRGKDDIPAIASWEKAEQVIGHLMKPTEHYPPRVEVSDFPTEAELAALGKATP
jgi:hypothetical protein